ncbi:uncharacterized protein LOC107874048 [Capsicum annuum]|uniref:uncharacterized protein LOC107874048 n=1 Tax=Capsicum annuum TaxID=4072 RepID=UPI001FB19432|nr:uncharacterized protein LOC107874048 [Capsicum annuum]
MNVATDESIHLHDPNGSLIEMHKLIDDGLLQEHHEIQEDATEEEYETEELRKMKRKILKKTQRVINMARGRGRGRGSTGHGGKFAVRSNNDVTANIPTVPTPTIVSPQADGIGGQNDTNQVQPLIPHLTSMVQIFGNGSNHTTLESSPTAPNQINTTAEGGDTGRGSIGHVGKSAARSDIPVLTANMPTIPTPTVAPQIAGGVGAPTSLQLLIMAKHFYWDSSISDVALKKQWQIKATIVYRNFIAKIKEKGIRQDFIPEDVWESWQRLWADLKCIEK